MIKVTVTATAGSVVVQDPRPTSQNTTEQSVITIADGATKSLNMQWGQFERIAQQLTDLSTKGLCSFTVVSADGPGYAAQADDPSNPIIDLITGSIEAADGGEDIILKGVNLLGGQTLAALTLPGDAGTGAMVIKSLIPGFAGNLIDVRVINTSTGGLQVTSATVSGRTVITVNLRAATTATVTTVTAAIATAMEGVVSASATGTGSDLVTTLVPVTPLTGGVGAGLTLTVGGVAATVTAIDLATPTAETLTFSVGTVGTTSNVATVLLRSNEKVATSYVVLDNLSNPVIYRVAGAVSAASGVNDGVITGVNLLGGQTLASLTLPGDAETGAMVIKSLIPGAAGNLIDVTVIDTSTGGLQVTSATVSGRTVITVNLRAATTATVTTVTSAIAAAMGGVVSAAATGTGSDLVTTLVPVTPLTGGVGAGTTLTVGGVAATIVGINIATPTAETITYDLGAVGTATNVATVHLQSNGKVATSYVVLAS